MTELCYLGENIVHSSQGRPLNFDLEHSIIDPFHIKKPLPPISLASDWNSYPRMQQIFEHTRQLLGGQLPRLSQALRKAGVPLTPLEQYLV